MENKGLIVKKDSVFAKICNFFKNIFIKNNNENIVNNNLQEASKCVENNFQKELYNISKYAEIQKKLDKEGINEYNLRKLIKDLSYEEKLELKKWYFDQNESIKFELKTYKKKIETLKNQYY